MHWCKSKSLNYTIQTFAKQPVGLHEGKPMNKSFWHGGEGHQGCNLQFRRVAAASRCSVEPQEKFLIPFSFLAKCTCQVPSQMPAGQAGLFVAVTCCVHWIRSSGWRRNFAHCCRCLQNVNRVSVPTAQSSLLTKARCSFEEPWVGSVCCCWLWLRFHFARMCESK